MKKTLTALAFSVFLLSCSSDTPWSAADVCPEAPSSMLDERDGKSYRTVKIGNQIWMAENLNYITGNNWCYDDDDSNCEIYGRLYDFETANAACPAGWHLPSDEEWKVLGDNMGGSKEAGKRLKAASGWSSDGSVSPNGTDDCGFSALPGGERGLNLGFNGINVRGNWWTSTQYNESWASVRTINSYYDDAYKSSGHPLYSYASARCVKD